METKLIIAQVKKNLHHYKIIDKYTAGIELTGNEIKSVRKRSVSLDKSYGRPSRQELYLFNLHITSYQSAPSNPRRERKLLLHKWEIKRIIWKLETKGYELIPLQLFIDRGWAKLEIALAQRLRKYQIKEKIKEKEIDKKLKKEDFW